MVTTLFLHTTEEAFDTDMIWSLLWQTIYDEEEDTNATSASTDIPASVIQFMKLQLHERTGIPSVVEDDEDADY